MANSNKQTTFAKLARERRVQEKRTLKQEKKEQRKQAKDAASSGAPLEPERAVGDDAA